MLRKLFSILISIVLLTLVLTPITITSNANNKEEQTFVNSDTKVIENRNDYMVTQIEVDNKVYEYIEVISGDIIKTEIFEVDGESRILVDTITTKIEASGDQLEITQSDTDIDYFKDFSLENNDPISDNSVMFSTQSLSGFWKNTWVKMSYKKDYKKKMGYARFTRSEKKVKLPSKPFDNYAKQVDNLVSIQQGALLSIGPIGMIESLVGFLSHKKLTPAVVKQAIKKFGGKIPGIGTIYSLINYVYTYDKAVKAFNKIPGNAYWWK